MVRVPVLKGRNHHPHAPVPAPAPSLRHPCSVPSSRLPLQGQYPVIKEDAAQMCALQMQAEYGPTLANDAEGMEAALEKYMVKQVLHLRYCTCGTALADS